MFAPKSYTVRKLSITQLSEANYMLTMDKKAEMLTYIRQQDNQLFRQIRLITGEDCDYNRWIVFVDSKHGSHNEEALTQAITNGFSINGQHFVFSERSASMTRQSTLSFVDAAISGNIAERVKMGAIIERTVLSKYYAYRGLMLSSCHCIEGWMPKVIVVPDHHRVIPNQTIKCLYDKDSTFVNQDGEKIDWVQKDVMQKTIDVEINAFDGCGIHHPAITNYIQNKLQSKTRPTSMIIRAPYIKGVSHEVDYVGYYEEIGVHRIWDIWGVWHDVMRDAEPMIILTESMYKGYKYFKNTGTSQDWAYYWQMFKKYDHCWGVAKWNFSREEEPVYTRLNYQVLQDLKLPYETFVKLAKTSVDWAERIMNGDKLYTYCFLGLMADNQKSLNDYCRAIAKNPAMMHEESVRKSIRNLLSKYRDEMKCGKLYVRSCFRFLCPDLIMLLEHIAGKEPVGCLENGEFFSHDINSPVLGERVIERNPHICHSEHAILQGVEPPQAKKWLSHLDNICMVNCKSIITAKLQGCDYDGDLVIVVDDDMIKSGIDRTAITVMDVDDKITVEDELDTPENRLKIVLRTMKNLIGEYSNYASVYHNKCPKDADMVEKYRSYIDIISVLTGKSIDYAKTGVLYPMPRHIAKYGRPLPYFMKYRSDYYRRSKLSKTMSNMNRLCYEIEKWDRQITWSKNRKNFDYTIMIDDTVAVECSVFKQIEAIYLRFLKEMKELAHFQHMCRNYDNYSEELSPKINKSDSRNFEIDWGFYYEQYRKECLSVLPDTKALANAVVRLCYEEHPKKNKKFMWVVASDGILQNIQQIEHMLPIRDSHGQYDYLGKKYNFVPYKGELIS